MERGGFDAVVGNPPFLGGTKISGAAGGNFLDWLRNVLAEGNGGGGRADIVAYFLLRAVALLTRRGSIGLIATNTIAQGDTREIGLDRLAADGITITRSIQSRPWPAVSANLEYAAFWGGRGPVAAEVPRIADDIVVKKISTLLEPEGRVEGLSKRLPENQGVTFEGCKPYGVGFVLTPEEAAQWIEADPKNAEVLSPYLTGEDLNSRSDSSPSRWVIDFNDRSESQAQEYALPFQRVLETVKPERAKKPKAVREAPWWRFLRTRPAMRKAIADAGLEDVLVIARVSKTVMPSRMQADIIPSEQVVVFAKNSYAVQAVLSSSLHQTWAIKYGSGMRNDPRYTPSDVFETFPLPSFTDELTDAGRTLDTKRREIMLRRDLGLTKLYNLVNDPGITDSADLDVARIREIHVDLDQAVMAAYGWDVPLEHGFHTYRQMQRWTVSPAARVEVLDRLLEENHRRAASQGVVVPIGDNEATEEEEGDE
ncbi:type IIL restriction-modification enzyme MmeI [Streptomyces sp. DSM 118878]